MYFALCAASGTVGVVIGFAIAALLATSRQVKITYPSGAELAGEVGNLAKQLPHPQYHSEPGGHFNPMMAADSQFALSGTGPSGQAWARRPKLFPWPAKMACRTVRIAAVRFLAVWGAPNLLLAPQKIPKAAPKVSAQADPIRQRSGFPLGAQGLQRMSDLPLHPMPTAPEKGRRPL